MKHSFSPSADPLPEGQVAKSIGGSSWRQSIDPKPHAAYSRASFDPKNPSFRAQLLLNRTHSNSIIGLRESKNVDEGNKGYASQRRFAPKEGSASLVDSYRQQSSRPGHFSSLPHTLENCERQVIYAIQNRSGSVNTELRSDIASIFKKLRDDLKNKPLEIKTSHIYDFNSVEENEKTFQKISSEFDQAKEELNLGTSLLKIELDKMKFQLSSLVDSFNTKADRDLDMLVYKKIVGVQKSLEKAMEEFEKMNLKIKNCESLFKKQANSAQTLINSYKSSADRTQPFNKHKDSERTLRRVKVVGANDMLDKVCYEAEQLLGVLESIRQAAARNDEEAVLNYRMDLEDQRNVLSSLLAKARFEDSKGRGESYRAPAINILDYESRRADSEIVRLSLELNAYKERLHNAERELDSVQVRKSVAKSPIQLAIKINKLANNFSEANKAFEDEVQDKIEEHCERLEKIKKNVGLYKSAKKDEHNKMKAKLLEKDAAIEEMDRLLRKSREDKANESAKRGLLEKEVIKLKSKLNNSISTSKAKREMREIQDGADKKMRDLALIFVLKVESKLQQLDSATRNAKGIIHFKAKQHALYTNAVKQLKQDNERLRQEGNALKERMAQLNHEVREKEEEVRRSKDAIKGEANSADSIRDEVKRQKQKNERLRDEISELKSSIKDIKYERDALADSNLQLKREKDSAIAEKNAVESETIRLEKELNNLMEERAQLSEMALEINKDYKSIVDEKATLEDNEESLKKKLQSQKARYEKLLNKCRAYITANNQFHGNTSSNLNSKIANMKKLINDYNKLKERLVKLFYYIKEQFNSLRNSILGRDQMMMKYEEVIKKINSDAGMLMADNEVLAQQNQKLNAEIDRCRKDIERATDNLVMEKKCGKEVENALEEKFNNELHRLNEEVVKKLNKDIETQEKSISELKGKLKGKEEVEREKEELEDDIRKKAAEIKSQKALIDTLKNEIEAKEMQVKMQANTLNNLRESIIFQAKDEPAQPEIKERSRRKLQDEDSKAIKGEVNALKRELQELNDALSNKEDDIKLQKELISKLQNKVAEKDEEVKLEKDLIEKLNMSVKRKDEEMKGNEEEVKKLSDAVSALNLKLRNSGREQKEVVENLNEEVRKKDKEIALQQSKAKELEGIIKAQEDEIEKAKGSAKELKKHKSTIVKLKKNFKNNEQESKKQQELIQSLITEAKSSKEALNAKQEEVDSLIAEKNQLREQINDKEAQVEALLNEEVKECSKAQKRGAPLNIEQDLVSENIPKEDLRKVQSERLSSMVAEVEKVKEELPILKGELKIMNYLLHDYGANLAGDIKTVGNVMNNLVINQMHKDELSKLRSSQLKEQLLEAKNVVGSMKQDKEDILKAHNDFAECFFEVEDALHGASRAQVENKGKADSSGDLVVENSKLREECKQLENENEVQSEVLEEYKEKLQKHLDQHRHTLNELPLLKAKGIEAVDELESFKVAIAEMQRALENEVRKVDKASKSGSANVFAGDPRSRAAAEGELSKAVEEKSRLEATCRALKDDLKASETQIQLLEKDNKELEETIVEERQEHAIELNNLKDDLESNRGRLELLNKQKEALTLTIDKMKAGLKGMKEDFIANKDLMLEDMERGLEVAKEKSAKGKNNKKQKQLLKHTQNVLSGLKRDLRNLSTSQQKFTSVMPKLRLDLLKLKDSCASLNKPAKIVDEGSQTISEEAVRVQEPEKCKKCESLERKLRSLKRTMLSAVTKRVNSTNTEFTNNTAHLCQELSGKLVTLNEKVNKVKVVKDNYEKLESDEAKVKELMLQAVNSLNIEDNEETELVPLAECVTANAVRLYKERLVLQRENVRCREYLQRRLTDLPGNNLFELCKEIVQVLNNNKEQLDDQSKQLEQVKELMQHMAMQYDDLNAVFMHSIMDRMNKEGERLADCCDSMRNIKEGSLKRLNKEYIEQLEERERQLTKEKKMAERSLERTQAELKTANESLSTACSRLSEFLNKHGVVLSEAESRSPELLAAHLASLVSSLSERPKKPEDPDWKPLASEETPRVKSERVSSYRSKSDSLSGAVTAKEEDAGVSEYSSCGVEGFRTPEEGSEELNASANAQIRAEYEEVKGRIKIIIRTWEGREGGGTIDEVERIIEAMAAELEEAKRNSPHDLIDKDNQIEQLSSDIKKLNEKVKKYELILEEKNRDVRGTVTA